MNTDYIYQYTFNQLLKFIKEKRETFNSKNKWARNNIKPLITLGDEVYDLNHRIVESSTLTVKTEILSMIHHIIDVYSKESIENELKFKNWKFLEHDIFDLIINDDNKKIAYRFYNNDNYDAIYEYKKKEFDGGVVVHMNQYDDLGYRCIIDYYNNRNLKSDISVRHMTFQEFYTETFGENEFYVFLDYLNNFNEQAQKVIGYNTVLAPTEDNIEAFKKITLKELVKFEKYDTYLKHDLTSKQLEKLREYYFGHSLYKVMLGDSTFANSFLSSEWNYKIYTATNTLDQTGIVAGYLKSVEQLLLEIAKLHVGDNKVKIKKSNWEKPDKLTEKVLGEFDFTLGELEKFLEHNKKIFGAPYNVRKYVVNTIKKWREDYRNNYFHKKVLNNMNIVDEIRDKTICLYFLLLGGCDIRKKDVIKLKPYVQNEEDYKTEEIISFEVGQWIDEVLDYKQFCNSEAIRFNLIIEPGYGWSMKLTTIDIKELNCKSQEVKFDSGKNYYMWQSNMNESEVLEFMEKILKAYIGSEHGTEKLKDYLHIEIAGIYNKKIIYTDVLEIK